MFPVVCLRFIENYLVLTSMYRKAKHSLSDFVRKRIYKYSELFSEKYI